MNKLLPTDAHWQRRPVIDLVSQNSDWQHQINQSDVLKSTIAYFRELLDS